MRNSAISTKKCQSAATSKTAQIFLIFQHSVCLSSVTRAALWSSGFQEIFLSHVSLGHTSRPIQAIWLALVSWATSRVGVHHLFPLAFHISGAFSFTFFHLPFDFIRVSSLQPTYLHPFCRPFTYSLF